MMSAAQFAVNFFVALFALIDPVGNTPLFAAATAGAKGAGRRLTAVYISIFAFFAMTAFFLTGLSVLRYFGISMPAFRIAGGVLLFLTGLDMARGELADTLGEAAEEGGDLSTRAYARRRFERLVAPFGMPLLVGPGAISTAVIYAGDASRLGFVGLATGIAVIGAVAVTIMLSFWMTGLITRALGRVGMIVVIRVLGLILCAMAVQFIMAGVAASTTGLVLPEASSPYGK
jgi:multiple antibiotic resistance protein